MAINTYAGERLYEDVQAKVVSAYDSIIIVNIDGIPKVFGDNLKVKIKNIRLPNADSSCKEEVRLAPIAQSLLSELLKTNDTITLKNVIRSTSFQVEADIILSDGANLRNILIDSSLASGSLEKGWCEK